MFNLIVPAVHAMVSLSFLRYQFIAYVQGLHAQIMLPKIGWKIHSRSNFFTRSVAKIKVVFGAKFNTDIGAIIIVRHHKKIDCKIGG